MNNQKKTLEITGRPLCPIAVGNLAWIQEEDCIRRTSSVVRLKKTNPSEIQFETQNTLYLLHLDSTCKGASTL